jgi:hypothetical protein
MNARNARNEPATRLFALVARAARVAVVLRRGPSKQVEMLRWDLARDTIERGQWLSGRIYNERCGLSPRGDLLVYFAGKFKTAIPTFTAICRPPYFTALALWPDQGTWGGGGFFASDRRVILNYGRVPEELDHGRRIPADFEIGTILDHRARHGDGTPEANQGWHLRVRGVDGEPPPGSAMRVVFAEPWLHDRPSPVRPRLALERSWLGMFEVNGPNCVYSYRLVERRPDGAGQDVAELGRLDWADWDHDGSLLYADQGRLYRRRLNSPLARPGLAPVEVADLRHHVFRSVHAPAVARVWP